ncbi:MAG TPA: phosphoadenylyl-sulfate reductase [Candidatus Sulfotelmatobacter sp.]|jgi:phosphoadenosine phosphosulfate reductase
MKEHILHLQPLAKGWGPELVLHWAFETFGNSVAISSAFGAEGMVVIDIANRLRKPFRIFTLDTDFLFAETYSLMDQIEQRYGITVEKVYSLTSTEEQEQVYGRELWERDPDLCCNLRKVEPLRRKLCELSAWITSIRRDQTAARSNAGKIEWDEKFGLAKINPIVDWSSKQVWQYIREHDVPYNPLHDQGYPSIGCTHCTRAVRPGEDPRAGRWAGFSKKECGLHIIQPTISAAINSASE